MHKKQLIKEIARVTKLQNKNVETVINTFTETVMKFLKKGEEIKLIGFGTFKTVKTKARTGRNPKTGKELKIPAKRKVKFSTGTKLNGAVK